MFAITENTIPCYDEILQIIIEILNVCVAEARK